MLQATVRRFMPVHVYTSAVLFILSTGLGIWWMISSLQMLKHPFRVPHCESSMQEAWLVIECFLEMSRRQLATWRHQPAPFDKELRCLQRACTRQYRTWKVRMARRDFYVALKRKRISFDGCERLLLTFLDAGPQVVVDDDEIDDADGVLPGTLEEAEEFLNLNIDDDSDAKETKNHVSIDYCFQKVADAIEEHLQFSPGERVVVDMSVDDDCKPNAYGEGSQSIVLAAAESTTRTGSVVYTFPGYAMVLFDGQPPPPVAVPASKCRPEQEDSHVTDNALLEDESLSVVKETSVANTDAAKATEPAAAPDTTASSSTTSKRKYKTVQEALDEEGWTIVRTKRHICYRRVAKSANGQHHEQHFVRSKTRATVGPTRRHWRH